MGNLYFNIYSADCLHATWTAYILTFTLQIPSMLHGQPTFQNLLCRFPPFYMYNIHFNIYSADSRHSRCTAYISTFIFQIPNTATWTAYISTFKLQIPSMPHGQPTFQHLNCRFPPCYMDSVHFNIYSED